MPTNWVSQEFGDTAARVVTGLVRMLVRLWPCVVPSGEMEVDAPSLATAAHQAPSRQTLRGDPVTTVVAIETGMGRGHDGH